LAPFSFLAFAGLQKTFAIRGAIIRTTATHRLHVAPARIMPKVTRPWTEREWELRLKGLTIFGALLGIALVATVADAVLALKINLETLATRRS
jgi:hypothetical protein